MKITGMFKTALAMGVAAASLIAAAAQAQPYDGGQSRDYGQGGYDQGQGYGDHRFDHGQDGRGFGGDDRQFDGRDRGGDDRFHGDGDFGRGGQYGAFALIAQERRIQGWMQNGMQQGWLDRGEASRAWSQMREIRQQQDFFLRDGRLDWRERYLLQARLDRLTAFLRVARNDQYGGYGHGHGYGFDRQDGDRRF